MSLPTMFQQVQEFNQVMRAVRYGTAVELLKDTRTRELRIKLIAEELSELEKAQRDCLEGTAEESRITEDLAKLAEVFDALGDLIYVICGMADTMGIDFDGLDRRFPSGDPDAPAGVVIPGATGEASASTFKTMRAVLANDYVVRIVGLLRESLTQISTTHRTHADYITFQLLRMFRICKAAIAKLGADPVRVVSLIHESNMSKSCRDEDTAIRTVKRYEETADTHPYTAAYTRASEEYFIVYDLKTGKVLKSIEYTPVDLVQVVRSAS